AREAGLVGLRHLPQEVYLAGLEPEALRERLLVVGPLDRVQVGQAGAEVPVVPLEPQARASLPSPREQLEGSCAAGQPGVDIAVAARLADGPRREQREDGEERGVGLAQTKRDDVPALDDHA